MTQREAKSALLKCFRALTPTQRKRLAWHAEQKTPVLCGDQADWFSDGKGGG